MLLKKGCSLSSPGPLGQYYLMAIKNDPTPVVLTIAGFDPSGGAGVLADVRTLQASGCRPVAAMTSLTCQNSTMVFSVVHQSAQSLRDQILPLVDEYRIAAVKIGMLATRELVSEVVRLWGEYPLPAPIVDPVLRSSSGYELMESTAREAWLEELVPLARLITPNIPEAEILSGMKIENESDMQTAARALRDRGAPAVLIKGGHLNQKSLGVSPAERAAVDVLDDLGIVTVFRGEWIEAPMVRGTGCMLSSAITAGLANGGDLESSIRSAKLFVLERIREAS